MNVRVTNKLAVIGLVMMLAGCGGGNQFADLRAYMREVERQPVPPIQPLPEFEPYQPFTYGAANLRSPFVPPVILPPQTEQQIANRGVRPPKDHVKQFLERFNLATLSMVGSLQQDNNMWALIEDGTGGVHRVQVGDYMGTNYGRIESINDTRLDITEIVSDGQGGWLRRPRSLELRGLSD